MPLIFVADIFPQCKETHAEIFINLIYMHGMWLVVGFDANFSVVSMPKSVLHQTCVNRASVFYYLIPVLDSQ